MPVDTNSSAEFNTWLADRLAGNANADTDSVGEYVFSVLTADADCGESDDTLVESARDIVENFELCQQEAEVQALAEQIVSEFKRLRLSTPASDAGNKGDNGHAALSSVEAEALAKARSITVQEQQQNSAKIDKQAILLACASIDDRGGHEGEEEDDAAAAAAASGGAGADGELLAGSSGLGNRGAVEQEERLKRERMKLQHAQKLERDKADREKQKKAKEARKEAEKKRTQKQERRK